MGIDLKTNETYELHFYKKGYKKAKHKRKADRLARAFFKYYHGCSGFIIDAQYFNVKFIREDSIKYNKEKAHETQSIS